MRPTAIRMIATALLVMSLAGCYPRDVPDRASAIQGTPGSTQPKQAVPPASAGMPLAPASPLGNEIFTEGSPAETESPAPSAPSPPAPEQTSPAKQASPAPSYDSALQPLVEAAITDLAGRLDVNADEIEVVEAQVVVWPDASMGCPQPGMRYLQVPQDGAFIQLSVGGKLYNYHIGGNRSLFLCEQKGKSAVPPSFDELQLPGGGGEDL